MRCYTALLNTWHLLLTGQWPGFFFCHPVSGSSAKCCIMLLIVTLPLGMVQSVAMNVSFCLLACLKNHV